MTFYGDGTVLDISSVPLESLDYWNWGYFLSLMVCVILFVSGAVSSTWYNKVLCVYYYI